MALAISNKSIWVKILVMLCALALLAVFALPSRAHAFSLSLSYGLIGSILGSLGFAAPSAGQQYEMSENAYNSLSSAAKALLTAAEIVTTPFGDHVKLAGSAIKLIVSEIVPWARSHISDFTFSVEGAFPLVPQSSTPLSSGFCGLYHTAGNDPDYYFSSSSADTHSFLYTSGSNISFVLVSSSSFSYFYQYTGYNQIYSGNSVLDSSSHLYIWQIGFPSAYYRGNPNLPTYSSISAGLSSFLNDPGDLEISLESQYPVVSQPSVVDAFSDLDDSSDYLIPVSDGSVADILSDPDSVSDVPAQSDTFDDLQIGSLIDYSGSIAEDTHSSLNIFQQIWSWLQSFWANLTSTITGAISGVVEGVSSLVAELDAILEAVANPFAEFFTNFLPSFWSTLVGTINGSLLNFASIWHYVVSWVGSLGSGFALIRSVWSGLPYAMVVPIYASIVITIVFFIFKRIFF